MSVTGGLIAPKHITDYTPEDYIEYVRSMYELRTKGRKTVAPAPGLSVSRTKSGKLSIRRSRKQRAFDYVTLTEIEKLAAAADCSAADLWAVFKQKNYIVAHDRLEAERAYAAQRGIQL